MDQLGNGSSIMHIIRAHNRKIRKRGERVKKEEKAKECFTSSSSSLSRFLRREEGGKKVVFCSLSRVSGTWLNIQWFQLGEFGNLREREKWFIVREILAVVVPTTIRTNWMDSPGYKRNQIPHKSPEIVYYTAVLAGEGRMGKEPSSLWILRV